MIERLLILVAFTAGMMAAFELWRLAQQRRLRALAQRPPADVPATNGHPAILYFTTPECAQCRLQQTPILERLLQDLEHPVVLHKVNALEHEDLARQYGVLTVPTTVILDAKGRPQAINHGLATPERLREQIQRACHTAD